MTGSVVEARPGGVLDVRMPGLTGLDLQETLARSGHQVPIVFIMEKMRAGSVAELVRLADLAAVGLAGVTR